MGWISDPRTYTLDELKDLEIGQTTREEGGCCPKGIGDWWGDCNWAGLNHPYNGEFEAISGSRCRFCNWGKGKECGDPDGMWEGGKPVIRRKAFRGDEWACCRSNARGQNTNWRDGNNTCSFLSRNPNSLECRGHFTNHCSVSDRIVSDNDCRLLQNSSRETHTNLMRTYCNSSDERAQSSACREWCPGNEPTKNCQRVSTIDNCKIYGIESNCSAQKVDEIINKCKSLGIMDNLGNKSWTCSLEGIKELQDECKKYNLSDANCIPTKVEAAQQLAEMIKQGEKLSEQIKKADCEKIKTLKKAIGPPQYPDDKINCDGIGVTPSGASEDNKLNKDKESNNMLTIIISSIVVCILLFGISSILGIIII